MIAMSAIRDADSDYTDNDDTICKNEVGPNDNQTK